MKRILFPTDFSENSLNAFEYALDLADNQNSEIVVLHTYDSIHLNSGQISPKMFDNFKQNIDLKELQGFKAIAPKFHEIAIKSNLNHIKLEFILEQGELVSIIKEKVVSESISIIVMGSSSNEDANSSVLGTNTYETIIQTSVPVLCVPPFAKFEPISCFAFLTVFHPNEKKSLDLLLDIAFRKQIKVKCIYVDNKNEKYHNVLDEWKQHFDHDLIEFVVLKDKSATHAVKEYLLNNEIGMIATVKRNQTFFDSLLNPSFTKALAKNIKIPLLACK